MQDNIKKASELRLSFGIAVANALEDQKFREYLKKISNTDKDSFYNEILFAIHKDDIVNENKTLAQTIQENADKETIDLYGDDFINKILSDDPLVCIKIPDIFYGFNWETNKYAPLVAIKTPTGVGSNSYTEYVGFHCSGYYDYFPHDSQKDYFTIVVKYSEDYILYNPVTKRKEKNISIIELIPQLENCWETINSIIEEYGIKNPKDPSLIYLKRRDIITKFIEECENDYVYYGEQVMNSCQKECIRDCIENGTVINDVFEKITVLNPMFINISTSYFFQDNFDIFFFIFKPEGQIIDKCTIAGYRKKEYYSSENTFDSNISIEYYDKIGKVILPRVKINRKYTKNKEIYFNYRWRKGWKTDDSDYVMHNFSVVSYSDLVYNWPIEYKLNCPELILHCSEAYVIPILQ
jgi:hypothetical protein